MASLGILLARDVVRNLARRALLALIVVRDIRKLSVGADVDRGHELDDGVAVWSGRGPLEGPSDRGRQHHADRVHGVHLQVREAGLVSVGEG